MMLHLLGLIVTFQITLQALPEDWGFNAIQASQAQKISNGGEGIVIAVIDTGLDLSHPDLKDHLWINPGESGTDSQGKNKSNNGIDDDKNGFIDDVHGWNFARNSSRLTDHHGHGTHIAGLISKTAPKAKLMVLKYLDENAKSSGSLRWTQQALLYAIEKKVDIINYSGGGITPSLSERQILQRAGSQGILVVAAAGNEMKNSDKYPYYPADYGLPNIVSVGALKKTGGLVESSNFGLQTVQLTAPGENILSTFPNESFKTMTGTSQATAYVSGAAALLMSFQNLQGRPLRVVQKLRAGGNLNSMLKGKLLNQIELNTLRPLQLRDSDENALGDFMASDTPMPVAGFSPNFDAPSVNSSK